MLVNETAGAITFTVRVQPRARRNAVIGELGEAIKLALTAPPVEGRANDACVDFLADILHVPGSAVSIIGGHSSRNKVIRVTGITAAQLRERLQL